MSLLLEVAGSRYGRFESASVTWALDALSRSFEFVATSSDARPLPFRGGEACRVVADGEIVLTGFVERVEVSGDSASHEILVSGRDRNVDLMDSTIDALPDIRPPISLADVARRVVSHLGASIFVRDASGAAPFNEAEDLAAPEPGQNAFEFLEVLARKRQVLLTSSGDGSLVIAAASGRGSGASILHLVDDPGGQNNVLRYSVSYDHTARYRRYRSVSQLNPIPLNVAGDVPLEDVVEQASEEVIDSSVRAGRQLAIVSESMFSGPEGDKRAAWEANVRKARSQVYGATVDGFRNSAGRLWAANELVRVSDDYAGIQATMLVNSVTFSLTPGEGSLTTLALVPSDAYTLELSEPRDEELGLGLF